MTGLLLGAHLFMAQWWPGGPHWALSDAEAKGFAQSWANVLRHYPLQTTQKAIDHLALIGTFGLVYTPRFYAHRQWQAARRAGRGAQRPAPMGTVYHLSPNQPPPAPAYDGHPSNAFDGTRGPGNGHDPEAAE